MINYINNINKIQISPGLLNLTTSKIHEGQPAVKLRKITDRQLVQLTLWLCRN